MAIKKSLTFDLYGKDKTASKTIRGVGKEADSLGKRIGKVGAGIAGSQDEDEDAGVFRSQHQVHFRDVYCCG